MSTMMVVDARNDAAAFQTELEVKEGGLRYSCYLCFWLDTILTLVNELKSSLSMFLLLLHHHLHLAWMTWAWRSYLRRKRSRLLMGLMTSFSRLV